MARDADPRASEGGNGVPAGSANARVWLTCTPDSGTVPQLVTVTSVVTVGVGGSSVGADPGPVDVTVAQLAPSSPGPPVETAGGRSPIAVMASRW